jgi:lantibiotic modifying enzyme
MAALRTVAGELRAFPHNSQPNYSLCHGVCGNAELLMAAARVLDEPDWLRMVESAALLGIDRHGDGSSPWPSGGAGAQETPSLMWGLAGTGYFYLRLAEPPAIPSVLLPRHVI